LLFKQTSSLLNYKVSKVVTMTAVPIVRCNLIVYEYMLTKILLLLLDFNRINNHRPLLYLANEVVLQHLLPHRY